MSYIADMSGTPNRHKFYMEQFFDEDGLPSSTEHRSPCARDAMHKQNLTTGVSTILADNKPSTPGNFLQSTSDLEDEDECEDSGTQVTNEENCKGANSHGAPADHEFSARELVTLVMDFGVTSGMSYMLVENLMKFVGFIQERDDLPDTKFLFQKFVRISLGCSTFPFYCPRCMLLLEKSAGDLKERKQVEATCVQCGQKYTGEGLLREGHFFVSLHLEQQLTSVLASEEVARSLKSSLQKIPDHCDPAAIGDITDGALYRKQ